MLFPPWRLKFGPLQVPAAWISFPVFVTGLCVYMWGVTQFIVLSPSVNVSTMLAVGNIIITFTFFPHTELLLKLWRSCTMPSGWCTSTRHFCLSFPRLQEVILVVSRLPAALETQSLGIACAIKSPFMDMLIHSHSTTISWVPHMVSPP